jgi:hypothetical protein
MAGGVLGGTWAIEKQQTKNTREERAFKEFIHTPSEKIESTASPWGQLQSAKGVMKRNFHKGPNCHNLS